jgi:hypothetical protein
VNERIERELQLLRTQFPALDYSADGGWILIPAFPLPSGIWARSDTALAVQFPPGYPGNPPYGFHVSPPLVLASGAAVQNASLSSEPPYPGTWQKFSWSVPEWRATANLASGFNMLNYVHTIRARLAEGA